MAVPTTPHIGRPCMQCTPSRYCGPGGGGAGLSPCRGLGEEGGGGRGTRASWWGEDRQGGGGGRGGLSRAPRTAARCGGQGHHLVPSAQGGGTPATHVRASTGWGGLGRHPCAHYRKQRRWWASRHRGLPPPRYHLRGYGCARPGGRVGVLVNCAPQHAGLGGREGGRGEGHGGLCGRAARCPHTWVRARGTRPAPYGTTATPPRLRGPRATPICLAGSY